MENILLDSRFSLRICKANLHALRRGERVCACM